MKMRGWLMCSRALLLLGSLLLYSFVLLFFSFSSFVLAVQLWLWWFCPFCPVPSTAACPARFLPIYLFLKCRQFITRTPVVFVFVFLFVFVFDSLWTTVLLLSTLWYTHRHLTTGMCTLELHESAYMWYTSSVRFPTSLVHQAACRARRGGGRGFSTYPYTPHALLSLVLCGCSLRLIGGWCAHCCVCVGLECVGAGVGVGDGLSGCLPR